MKWIQLVHPVGYPKMHHCQALAMHVYMAEAPKEMPFEPLLAARRPEGRHHSCRLALDPKTAHVLCICPRIV